MKYEDEKFIIYYNDIDSKYLPKLLSVIKHRMSSITNFFKVEFKDKVIIKLYNNISEYRENLELSFARAAEIESSKQHCYIKPRKYQEWMYANTEDGNINMQSLDLVRKIEGYEMYTEEEFCYDACHEFTHLCQQQLSSSSPGWFWEILACILGNPECQHISEEEFTITDLNERFDEIDGYGAVYTIGLYLFANYNPEFILSLVNDNEKLFIVMEKVINEIHNKRNIIK